ncbi:hypothetical protein NW754_010226 [Fusarium falciforme]|nr:hypothetical protein NW754_010226 [Fusarium falciforme]
MCHPNNDEGTCWYTDHYFKKVEGMKMHDQFDYKYLPDIDGNSFSGRYLGFLNSTSLPIKATLFREWHDSRLVPWVHFVPMDNRFQDFYGIMEYFLGYKDISGHDKVAEKIALEGRDWAGEGAPKGGHADLRPSITPRIRTSYCRRSRQDGLGGRRQEGPVNREDMAELQHVKSSLT